MKNARKKVPFSYQGIRVSGYQEDNREKEGEVKMMRAIEDALYVSLYHQLFETHKEEGKKNDMR